MSEVQRKPALSNVMLIVAWIKPTSSNLSLQRFLAQDLRQSYATECRPGYRNVG